MKYHALALAQNGFEVNIVGFPGSNPARELVANPRITIDHLPTYDSARGGALSKVFKAVRQSFALFRVLMKIPRYQSLLMQNPPAIPTLPIARLACWLRGAQFVVDFHNYGYTLMALNFGPKHPIVKVARLIEHVFGRTADAALCVSRAMQEDVMKNWKLKQVTVVYDVPTRRFAPIKDTSMKRDVIQKLHGSGVFEGLSLKWLEDLRNANLAQMATQAAIVEDSEDDEEFPVYKIDGEVVSGIAARPDSSFDRNELKRRALTKDFSTRRAMLQEEQQKALERKNRQTNVTAPRYQQALVDVFFPTSQLTTSSQSPDASPFLIVSSTSWTHDEDFGMLYEALVAIDRAMLASAHQAGSSSAQPQQEVSLPPMRPRAVLCVVTGNGELKAFYQSLFKQAKLKYVQFVTAWLAPEDYPRLLACANVGISLHNSSSGVDLPMKVVDMFGVNLPVIAYRFKALPELVEEGVTGEMFSTGQELATKLAALMDNPTKLQQMRQALEVRRPTKDWNKYWSTTVLRIFKGNAADFSETFQRIIEDEQKSQSSGASSECVSDENKSLQQNGDIEVEEAPPASSSQKKKTRRKT